MTLVTLRQPLGLMIGPDMREILHFEGEVADMGRGDRTYRISAVRLPYGQTTIRRVFTEADKQPVVTINESIIAASQELEPPKA
jgi:hypothetical protein